jgi:predicted phage terminase large subunit-like protein
MRLTRHQLDDIVRLMITAPPGSAKTTYTSRVYPAWFFATRPGSCIIGVSHVERMAELNSSHVQRIIREHQQTLGYTLLNDGKERWQTSNGCEYNAVGIGGTVRGLRADVIILDDPIKDREAAESEQQRAVLWEFFHSDLAPRLKPGGVIVLIGTPLHQDDLLCKLLREQADAWRVLRLPALSEGEGDALGRPEGTPLWSDDPHYPYGDMLLKIHAAAEREGRLRDWHAQYQGHPRPPEGAMFKPGRMPILEALPGGIHIAVRAWDLASSTRSSADYTVGIKLVQVFDQASPFNEFWIVTDVQRIRGAPEEVRRLVKAVAEADGPGTTIWLPQDPAQAGADQVESYIRHLSGYPVHAERMSGDKATRADSCASQSNIGRVALLRAPWNAAFIEELAAFPLGRHDDQVDALSLAFSKLSSSPLSIWARL